MPEVKKTYYNPKDIDVTISEIHDGIYRISGFVDTYGITFNQLWSYVAFWCSHNSGKPDTLLQ